ncbi:MAG: hypothetical protein MUP16_00615, partial [Sedimentisphaerales bacterium]|nr:hypothetical protein [Sedimentisphaerales bacterium]
MKKLILGFAFLFAAIPCQAKIITVDNDGSADFANIQAAIDDANNGDVVEVQPGTYTGPGNRNIDFKGKAITVRSIDPKDPNIIETTIIDCNGTEAEPHRGFYFHNHEGSASVLSGITVKNGYAAVGAGIYCRSASPTVDKCIIVDNTARHHGGGIYCETSNAIITNCVLRYNKAERGHGGGIFCLRSNPSINTCVINHNSAGSSGGGLFNNNSYPTLIDCQITQNSAGHHGGAIFNINGSEPIQAGCTLYDNQAGYPGNETYNYEDAKQNQTTLENVAAGKSFDNPPPQFFGEHSSSHIYYVNGACGNDDWTGLSHECTEPSGPKRTIQSAINDSNDGDIIIIYPGIYYECLLIQGKDISLRSVDPCDPKIVETTVFDGSGGGTVLRIIDANAVIDGLTVANGLGDPNGGGI